MSNSALCHGYCPFFRTLARGLLIQLVLNILSPLSGEGMLAGVAAETGIQQVYTCRNC